MSCKKTVITNTGTTLISFSYRDCSDGKWKYQEPLRPGKEKMIYMVMGTLYLPTIFEENAGITEMVFPPTPSNTRTPTVTPTNTPSTSVAPSVTPTRTPTKTPTKTPTSTPAETPTVTPTKTPTSTPTKTPTPTSSVEITPTPSPTNGAYTATTCNTTINSNIWAGSGGIGFFTIELTGITSTGNTVLNFDAVTVPDRFKVMWNDEEVINTGFVSNCYPSSCATYNQDLADAGYPEGVTGPNGSTSFVKSAATPSTVYLYIDAPLGGTVWSATLECPV